MTLDADDEILKDFLIEAGEILEQLNEELVELEQSPNDVDVLNSVFRGFHTIKGGASFLSLDGLVEVCHRAEDVFNVLRNGERAILETLAVPAASEPAAGTGGVCRRNHNRGRQNRIDSRRAQFYESPPPGYVNLAKVKG
jgi:chemotaxis protein histidine kinase CheA